MSCPECGQGHRNDLCQTCRLANRDDDERWERQATDAERRCQVELDDGGDDS